MMTPEERKELRARRLSAASAVIDSIDRACRPGVPWHLWPFDDAPRALRDLSENGGDEDWILVVPKGEHTPVWAEEGGAFGCCTVEQHELPCGQRVLIGCHA